MNEHKQSTALDQDSGTEPTVADDLLTVMTAEDHEAEFHKRNAEAFRRYQGGEISGAEYEHIVQVGSYNEASETHILNDKHDALDRINGVAAKSRLGHLARRWFRR